MSSNWKYDKLSNLCFRIGDGLHGTPEYQKFTDYFFINGNNLKSGKIEITKDTSTISEEEYKKHYIELDENTLFLGINGSIGNMAFYNGEKIMLGKSSAYLKFKTRINRFYYYYFQLVGVQKYFYDVATGSTIKNLSLKSIQDFIVPVPQKNEWEKIAHILSTLDAKIELNNRINTELEKMAKSLYDYWFVQFDFPNENGNPYKSSGGKMVWSEELKREIPEGWEVKKISDLIEINKSGDWGKEEKIGNYIQEVFCIRGADINSLDGKGECTPPNRFILEKNNHKLLNPYDLIIEISGGSPTQSTGRIAHISPTTAKRFKKPLICSNFCKALTLKDFKLAYNFHYFWNRLYDNNIFFGYEGKTSGIKNLLFDSFANTNYIIVPNNKIKNEFFDFMKNIEEKRQKMFEENQKLAELRDFLLPMLMNGQVRVG